MKTRWILSLAGLLILIGGMAWHYHRAAEPRRAAIRLLAALDESLRSNEAGRLLQTIALPAALRDRTPQEQAEFLSKALRDEISPEGLEVLQHEGQFGSLTNIFPSEGLRWAEQAGVRPDDCLGFKLEHNGICAEVVLVHEGNSYRVLRCNNVKQMAEKL